MQTGDKVLTTQLREETAEVGRNIQDQQVGDNANK